MVGECNEASGECAVDFLNKALGRELIQSGNLAPLRYAVHHEGEGDGARKVREEFINGIVQYFEGKAGSEP